MEFKAPKVPITVVANLEDCLPIVGAHIISSVDDSQEFEISLASGVSTIKTAQELREYHSKHIAQYHDEKVVSSDKVENVVAEDTASAEEAPIKNGSAKSLAKEDLIKIMADDLYRALKNRKHGKSASDCKKWAKETYEEKEYPVLSRLMLTSKWLEAWDGWRIRIEKKIK